MMENIITMNLTLLLPMAGCILLFTNIVFCQRTTNSFGFDERGIKSSSSRTMVIPDQPRVSDSLASAKDNEPIAISVFSANVYGGWPTYGYELRLFEAYKIGWVGLSLGWRKGGVPAATNKDAVSRTPDNYFEYELEKDAFGGSNYALEVFYPIPLSSDRDVSVKEYQGEDSQTIFFSYKNETVPVRTSTLRIFFRFNGTKDASNELYCQKFWETGVYYNSFTVGFPFLYWKFGVTSTDIGLSLLHITDDYYVNKSYFQAYLRLSFSPIRLYVSMME